MEPNEETRQPLHSRKGFVISTNDGHAITTLWTKGSGARFPTPRVHQIKGPCPQRYSRPRLRVPPTETHRARRRAEQGWARFISQNHCTPVHTLRRALFCNHPDILQKHQQYCRRLSNSWLPFDPSIRDLGPVPLSIVCIPYYEPFTVLITRAAINWT